MTVAQTTEDAIATDTADASAANLSVSMTPPSGSNLLLGWVFHQRTASSVYMTNNILWNGSNLSTIGAGGSTTTAYGPGGFSRNLRYMYDPDIGTYNLTMSVTETGGDTVDSKAVGGVFIDAKDSSAFGPDSTLFTQNASDFNSITGSVTPYDEGGGVAESMIFFCGFVVRGSGSLPVISPATGQTLLGQAATGASATGDMVVFHGYEYVTSASAYSKIPSCSETVAGHISMIAIRVSDYSGGPASSVFIPKQGLIL